MRLEVPSPEDLDRGEVRSPSPPPNFGTEQVISHSKELEVEIGILRAFCRLARRGKNIQIIDDCFINTQFGFFFNL